VKNTLSPSYITRDPSKYMLALSVTLLDLFSWADMRKGLNTPLLDTGTRAGVTKGVPGQEAELLVGNGLP
jgi:hypothetical protein